MKYSLIIFIIAFVMGGNAVYAQKTAVNMPSMVLVEGGTFMMGNTKGNKDEQPVHKVTLTSFYFGKYEVTYNDFKKFVDATGYVTDAENLIRSG